MNYKFKVVIWGLGTNGKNLIDVLGTQNVIAIIDSNIEIQNEKFYYDIPIIDFKEYKNKYSNFFIVITPMKYSEIENFLKLHSINKYFILNKSCVNLASFLELDSQAFIQDFCLQQNVLYLVYGINLFSIFLYQYLIYYGYQVAFISFTQNQSLCLKQFVSEEIINNYYQKEELGYTNVCIIQTENNDDFNITKGIPHISCDSLNKKFYSKWENNLRKFRNKHENERVFIIATGPSIQSKDLDQLSYYHEKTISMNSIYYIFEKTKWRPDYYIISDGLAMREYELNKFNSGAFDNTVKIFSDNYLKFWTNNLDNSYHCFRQEQDINNLRFSEDFSKVVHSGMTVVYTCLQWAVYLGFKEIYLLGCDFNFSKNFDSPNDHFYQQVEPHYTFDYETVHKSYEKAKLYANAHGIMIYNATRGGMLEVFPRVNFDDLFNQIS